MTPFSPPAVPPVALAHITFGADPGTSPGVIAVSLIDYQAGTSLSDTDGKNLDFTIINGQITVTGSAVSEPSSIVMAATALLLGLASVKRRSCAVRDGQREAKSRFHPVIRRQ